MLLAFLLRKQTTWIQHDESQVDHFLPLYLMLVVVNAGSLLVGNASSRSQQGLPLAAVLFDHFDVGAKMKNWS